MSALMAGAMAVCWIGFGVLRVLFGQPETWTLRAWSALIGASVVYLVLYHIAARRLTRGLTKSPLRLGVIDIAQRQAQVLPRWFLIAMTVMLLVVVIGAAFMVPVRPVFGVIGIVFCGP
jgi:hypothetical protein